jgi:hypothetical protein
MLFTKIDINSLVSAINASRFDEDFNSFVLSTKSNQILVSRNSFKDTFSLWKNHAGIPHFGPPRNLKQEKFHNE